MTQVAASLILLQCLVAWSSVRWRLLSRVVRAEPTLLGRDGRPIKAALRHERITEAEALTAVRAAGGRSVEEAEAVFLESDGSLSAILRR